MCGLSVLVLYTNESLPSRLEVALLCVAVCTDSIYKREPSLQIGDLSVVRGMSVLSLFIKESLPSRLEVPLLCAACLYWLYHTRRRREQKETEQGQNNDGGRTKVDTVDRGRVWQQQVVHVLALLSATSRTTMPQLCDALVAIRWIGWVCMHVYIYRSSALHRQLCHTTFGIVVRDFAHNNATTSVTHLLL